MAVILKSNEGVTGDNYKYITDKGMINKLTYNLYNRLKKDGLELSQEQINATNKLEQRIIDAGISEKIIEIHPYIGNTFGALFYKLKGLRNDVLINVSGINTEENADGGKGFHLNGRPSISQGVNPDVTLNDLRNGFELFFYSKHENNGGTAGLFGIGDGLGVDNSFVVYATSDEKIGTAINRNAIASSAKPFILGQFKLYSYALDASNYNYSSRRFYVNNGISFNNDTTGNFSTNVNDQSIYIGCVKSLTHSSIFGYKGSLRFSMITKSLNSNERELLTNAVLEFCNYLEK